MPRAWPCSAVNIGKQARPADAETTPLRDPEHYQYDPTCRISARSGGAELRLAP
jgi:hypothetical protein